MAQTRILAIPLATIDSATFTGAYQLVTTLPQACFILKIVNGSNTTVEISYDGTTDNDVIFTNTTSTLYGPIDTSPNWSGALFAKGMRIFVKGAANIGNAGTVGIVGYYQTP